MRLTANMRNQRSRVLAESMLVAPSFDQQGRVARVPSNMLRIASAHSSAERGDKAERVASLAVMLDVDSAPQTSRQPFSCC
mmetsp:Transcript_38320/g.83724  ORF Transcript_38320/g.83724 Transcript_38320/m.83724 type:complete len:81 (-) Transcript_38320:406-648(-)